MKRASLPLALLVAVVASASLAPTAQAAFPGRNGRIAYQDIRSIPPSESLGPFDEASAISSVLPDGGRPRTLLGFDRGFFTAPAYSPDGRRLALGSPPLSLFLLRADGRGRLRRLTRPRRGSDLYPSWAPDGRRLVFVRVGQYVRNANAQLRVYRAGRSRRVGPFRQGIDHPVWSVRGQIAFSSQMAIYTMRPDGSRRRFVTDGFHPDWSPHGRWIAFTPSPEGHPSPEGGVAIIRPDGRRLRFLASDGWDPAFSPDGRYIVFVRPDRVNHRSTLAVMRLRDRRTRTVLTAPQEGVAFHALQWPTWQPLPRRSHR